MGPKALSPNSLAFSLVGAGRVGGSLAHWLIAIGARMRSVVSGSLRSAGELADSLGQGQATPLSALTCDSDDLLLIAVSDTALDEVIGRLSARRQASVVLHTSGRAPGEILAPLRRKGSAIGSLHPLKAFPKVLADPSQAQGVVFGIDGDEPAQLMARRVIEHLCGVATVIPPAVRNHYHLAATMAAGGVVTLLASAADLAKTVGLRPEVIDGYFHLAQGALDQAQAGETIAGAITGPLARGDIEGLRRQIDQIRDLDPPLAELLEILAERSLHHLRSSTPGKD